MVVKAVWQAGRRSVRFAYVSIHSGVPARRMVVVAALVALTLALGSGQAAASADRVTKIYVGTRNVGYVHGVGPGLWLASWNDQIEGAWVEQGGSKTFFAGCGPFHDDQRDGYARRRSARLWTVSTFPQFSRLGSLHFRSASRWDIYEHLKLIGHTSGADAVVAGLAWLADRSCR